MLNEWKKCLFEDQCGYTSDGESNSGASSIYNSDANEDENLKNFIVKDVDSESKYY